MISIHALHEESDAWTPFADMANYKFQSTLSMRRATAVHVPSAQGVDISIHALHEESDGWRRCR